MKDDEEDGGVWVSAGISCAVQLSPRSKKDPTLIRRVSLPEISFVYEELSSFIDKLTKIKESHPDAWIEMETEEDYDCSRSILNLFYWREATPEEIATWTEFEKERKAYQENNERKELERLRRKYGDEPK